MDAVETKQNISGPTMRSKGDQKILQDKLNIENTTVQNLWTSTKAVLKANS